MFFGFLSVFVAGQSRKALLRTVTKCEGPNNMAPVTAPGLRLLLRSINRMEMGPVLPMFTVYIF